MREEGGVCVSVSHSEYFLDTERVFWSAEEKIPLVGPEGWGDDGREGEMLSVSWVEYGPEGGVPGPEDLN